MPAPKTSPHGTRDLTRPRPPLELLPSAANLPADLYAEKILELIATSGPRGKTIACDLDETLFARHTSCPKSWDPEPAPPIKEVHFEKMLPAPRKIMAWLYGDRSQRNLYSRKRYAFLSTEPEPTQVRPGFLPLLHALEKNGNTLLLITACDRYRLQYLNRLLPELFAPFGSRQIPLEDIAAHGANISGHSVLEKTPDLATLVGCPAFDLLIDDLPRAAANLEAKGQADRILSFQPNARPEIVLAEVLGKLIGSPPDPLPAPAPGSSFTFLDPCYLASEPDTILSQA